MTELTNLKQIALVTGASSGLGKAIALRLVEQNYHVVLASRNIEKLEIVKNEIENKSGKCTIIPTDVSLESSVQHLVTECDKLGFVGTVINNSGLGLFSKISNHSTEDWDQMINVNLRGAFLISRGFIPAMQNRKQGTLVFVNSVAGKWGYPFSAGYVASKYGLRGLADSLRNELRSDHIKVTSVHPGAVDSPFWDNTKANFPRHEMMQDDDVAKMVVQAITLSGNAVNEEIVIRRVQGDF
ncbi:MAG: SDR family oxidoreductase [Candidatus Marinimicrobia bacterium]|nr:SDR family oxidoreductase [Candidatus Neomarinimicrobiota bacterium]